ncbi:MAG: hypothetical protein US31_C0001G0052 [Berkelbacteria bacterium GW2011_GWA1_36_9]|uniref:GHMP kinase N-terminal domain-containing protein n=1 Tax=Berkelbacteria bacterium GW2011_GWA1_36_9 TaxID=1618331 RepID=A0A0G0FYL0_9BACT|nr:MAG: hypothetical protein US31_C0001G0052 [Berkelbacteria bacterium GW2011_GWA1_36_9]
MIQRDIVNSTNLRQKFPEIYQDLFSSCQIVISSADSFFWAGEYARFFGGLTIFQKLPTKNFVGLEVLDEKKFCFNNTLLGYNPSNDSFEKIPYEPAKEIRLINFLKDFWPTLDPTGKIKGLRIHILSESHCGGGLGSTGVVMACLAATLLVLAGKISTDEIEKWETATVDDLLHNDDYLDFKKVFRLGWRLTAICRDGNSSGATSFGALMHSSYPIIFFSKNINNFLNHPTIRSPRENLENCQIIEEIPFWGSTLEEIFPFRTPQPWPIDIARIYSGNLINTEHIFKSLSKLNTDIEKLEETINKELVLQIKNKDLSLKNLLDLENEHNQKFSYHHYLDIMNVTTVKLLLALKNLFTVGSSEELLRQFINVINQKQDFNHFLGHSTPLLDKICRQYVDVIAKENELNVAGAKIEGIGKGGHVLIIGPNGTMTDKFTKETEKLSEEAKKDIFLDWASWSDGFGESGLKVDQFLPERKYSSFISPQCCHLSFYKNGNCQTKLIEPENLKKIIKESDLAFLISEHKIYIKGKVLSSKEIPSAKATIEIIMKIIENPQLTIKNKSFNNHSYGQNRYDLQSKIFIPLNKALQKIAKKKLDFQIHGDIYDNFSVSLNIKNLNIALIDCLK